MLMLSFALAIGTPQLLWVLLFASLHELGHLLVLCLFGGKPARLTVAFYGVGLCTASRLNRWQELLFLLAGIGVNALFFSLRIHPEVNGPLLLINALPIVPLDMGRAVSLFLPYRLCRAVAVAFFILLVAAAVWLRNLSLAAIAGYILVFSLKEELT